MTEEAMSPLRRRMIEDMTIRKFAPKTPSAHPRGRCRTAGWRQAANGGCVSWNPYPSAGGCGIRLVPVSGGAIRRSRCGQGALRPTARASAPRPGRPSIGPRGRSRPPAGRRPPSDSGR